MAESRDVGAWGKIMKNSLDIISTIDIDGHIIKINDACESILGYGAEEIIGRKIADFIHPQDLKPTLKVINELSNGYRTNSFENRYLHKNGQEVTILWSAVWSEEAGVIFGVGRDISVQKLARQKDELYKALVKHGSDMLALFDQDLNFIYTGSSTFTQLGYQPEQLVGTSALQYIHPDDIAMALSSLTQVLASGGEVTVSDLRFRHANGEWRWLETTVSNQLQTPAIKALVASSRDITDRITDRLKLEESEQRFKSLFEHHLDIVLFQDRDGKIVDANPAALSFFGVRKEEILNQPFTDFIPPEIVPVCQETLLKALTGESVRIELAIPFENIGLFIFDVLKVPIIVNSQTIGVYTILRDITEIDRSNRTIKRQAAKLNTIFESITDAFVMLDKEWKVTYINKESERLLNIRRDKVIDVNLWDAFPEEVNGIFYQQYHHAIKHNRAVHFEAYFKRLGMWLQVRAFPSEEGLSIYFEDISEKVKSKQELEKLSLVASKTTNGVIIMDAEGRVEWANEGFTNLTGYTFAEVAGKKVCPMLEGEETDKAVAKRIWDKIIKAKPFTDEILNYKKSGEKLWLLLDMSPVLNEKGELSKVIIIQTDITFRKEAEEKQLQLTRDLFRQNRDLQQFTYIVSHNLRSPVANALGLADILTTLEQDSYEFKTSLAYLQKSVNQLDTVLQDLNMILSIRDQKDVIEKEKIALAQVCQQTITHLQESIKESGGNVVLEIMEDVYVQGNKAYFFSIFYNLLMNAIKYRSTERSLKVVIKCLGSTEYGTIISFSDNGLGFDMNLAEDKLFKLYKRFHTHSDGRGIGLFLVKTHLEAMAGHIEVSSEVNAGTRFLIYLK